MTSTLRQVIFTEKEHAQIEEIELSHEIKPDEVLLRTQWSLISVGTELAIYTNARDIDGHNLKPYPAGAGYAAMGVVEVVGSAIDEIAVGDKVYAATLHATHAIFKPAESSWLKLPHGFRDDHAPFIRMALITLATLRPADIVAGEWLGIVGLGIVGNLGAQFGIHAGMNIIGVGRSIRRSEIAAQCGINHILTGKPDKIAADVEEITDGEGCRFVLDTTGTMGGLKKAMAVASVGGTISVVGVPWQSDPRVVATEIMQPLFSRYITIQGGWEWGHPLRIREPGRALPMTRFRHSVEGNAQYAADCIASGKVKVEPLITHRIKPEDIQRAYQGVLHERNEYIGVLIDWREG